MDKFRQERAERNAPKGLIIDHDNLFVIIEVEELKYLLEVCYILAYIQTRWQLVIVFLSSRTTSRLWAWIQ